MPVRHLARWCLNNPSAVWCLFVASGACDGVASAVTRLSATSPPNNLTADEGGDAAALAEAQSVALELLLGAMSNLAPYRPEAVLDVSGAHTTALTHSKPPPRVVAEQQPYSAVVV